MSLETQSVLFNVVPLLAAAAVYAAASVVIARPLRRARRRPPPGALAIPLAFAGFAACAAVLGVVVAADARPLGGHLWVSLAATLAALAPALLVVTRTQQGFGPGIRARPAELSGPGDEEQVEQPPSASAALARAGGPEAIGEALLDGVLARVAADFAAVAVVSEDGSQAEGLVARSHGSDVTWWRDVRLDLVHQPSGIASAVFDAAPVAIYDVETSPTVSRELAHAVGAKSAAFVPLTADARVIGVLVVATTSQHRAFPAHELALMQALGGEAALELARLRAASALAEALERERLVATIARKVRSELDLDRVLRVVVEETGRALGLSRCLVRLGDGASRDPVSVEWHAEGLEPVGDAAARLPAANLAARDRRTVAVGDTATAPELEDPSLGGRETLAAAGSRAVLATPILVFDRMVAVLALHRDDPGAWSEADVALAETVAREAGLAIHTARLLAENADRVAQREALLAAARAVTAELELEKVLPRLVEQVARLLKADAADCYLLDERRSLLRCEAVYGLPDDVVGFEFPVDRGLSGEAVREGRPLVSTDYGSVGRPVPHPAYAGFTSAVTAPMAWSGRIRGVLGAGVQGAVRQFDENDLDLLEAFAGLAALAIRNAESFERSERQARAERGFYQIAAVLGDPLSLAATVDAVAEAACVALGGDFSSLLMPGERLELAGEFDLPEPLREGLKASPGADPVLVAASGAGKVIAAPAVARDDRFGPDWRRFASEVGFSSAIAVPLQVPRTEQNAMVVVYFREERRFVDEDLDLAGHLARAARGALERAELYESERKSRGLSQRVVAIVSALASELDPAAALDEIVEQAPTLLEADAATVAVLEDDDLVVVAAAGRGVDQAIGARTRGGGSPASEVLVTSAPVAVADVEEDERLRDADPAFGAAFRAYLGVPVVLPSGPGVLSVHSRRPRRWRPEEIESLGALAAAASTVLANAELHQSVAQEKERGVAILANVADGIVAVDREARVVLWNPAAERITGVAAEDALGRTPLQVLHRRLESDREVPSGDRLVPINRGAEEVWLSVTEAVMRDPAGAVSGRIFAFRDISADRAVEEIKSDFVSTVSHELRTPLTSIYGFAQTLLRSDVGFGDEERRTFLGYIASESERLTRIVDALLNVARLDTGDLSVQLAAIDVRDVVSQVVTDAREAASVNGHRFVVDLPAEPLDAQADREKLRQVLAQLVDNAVRYSPDGGTVTVSARPRAESVELEVIDEGVGIPHAEQDRIFRKFYRGEGAGRTGSGGTGLGLFIAHGLVTAMGGRIWVNSAEGRGARFGVELPVAKRLAARD